MLRMQPWHFATKMEKHLQHPEIFQYRVIKTEQIPFDRSVADACRANHCGKYGTCWTCPPGAGEYTQLERKIKAYPDAAIFTCKYDLEDSFDFDGMLEGQAHTMQLLREIIDSLRKEGRDFLALGCGCCNLCQKCTYPDAPCRFPDKAILSVESCGINVVELSKRIGVNYHNGASTVTYFCIILHCSG